MSPGGITDYSKFLADQEKNTQETRLADTLHLMKMACTAGTLPIIVDDGAIAHPNGVIQPEFEALYHLIEADPEVDAVIVARRLLYGNGGTNVPSLRVPKLDLSSTQNLIRIMGRNVGLVFDRVDTEAIATYSRGYPSAVRFALDEARERGIA